MGGPSFEKDGVGSAPALVDDGSVKASAPAGVSPYRTVIDPSPELERVIMYFGISDYLTMGAFTFFNAAGGYYFGASTPLPPSARSLPSRARARAPTPTPTPTPRPSSQAA